MLRVAVLSVLLLSVSALVHKPAVLRRTREVIMSASPAKKLFGVTAVVIGLAGPAIVPQSVIADGAVSASTIFRARNYYGGKIKDLYGDVMKGNFAAFDNKKTVNTFDLFISETNAQKSTIAKERERAELALQAKIFDAVKNKDRRKLASAYGEFIKVADLTSDYKPGELGQSDSSGYSPTYGTAREAIYQR